MTNIEGIQILNTYVTKSPDLFYTICLLLVGLIMGFCGAYFIYDDSKIEAAFCFFISIIMVSLTTYGLLNRNSTTHYDVLIDKSIPFVEVYDKYNIEGKDGDIYHLVLKKQTEKDKADD